MNQNVEIERKFLIDFDKFQNYLSLYLNVQGIEEHQILQSYLTTSGITSRVRKIKSFLQNVDNMPYISESACLTFKGETTGITRTEVNINIPVKDADNLFTTFDLKNVIQKTRYVIPFDNYEWEVDIFKGDNEGLHIAEIELDSEDQPFHKPDFILEEVSDDPKYYNSNLSTNPYKNW